MEYRETTEQLKLEGTTPSFSYLKHIVLRAIESLVKYFWGIQQWLYLSSRGIIGSIWDNTSIAFSFFKIASSINV